MFSRHNKDLKTSHNKNKTAKEAVTFLNLQWLWTESSRYDAVCPSVHAKRHTNMHRWTMQSIFLFCSGAGHFITLYILYWPCFNLETNLDVFSFNNLKFEVILYFLCILYCKKMLSNLKYVNLSMNRFVDRQRIYSPSNKKDKGLAVYHTHTLLLKGEICLPWWCIANMIKLFFSFWHA